MNIKGLDYNTERESLILPEYGREIQKMVDVAVALPDKASRQRCARTIVATMERMLPHNKDNADYKRKLWDHLAIMSEFKLDIDYPYDISTAKTIAEKPTPMKYPMHRIRVRHYGNMLLEILDRLKAMPAGKERDRLALTAAKQMKRDLTQWSHGSNDDRKVIADMERLTDGVIKLDPKALQQYKSGGSGRQQPKNNGGEKRKKNRKNR